MVAIGSIGRIFKAAGKLAFMDDAFYKTAESTLKLSKSQQGWKNIHKQIGHAFAEAESKTASEPFWTNLWKKQICGFPKDLANAWKGTSGAWGITKAVGGQVLKRLPVIFAALELPNIYSATKDEGILSGIKETVRSGVNLAGGMAGFIIGQALCPIPIVGGLIGGLIAGIACDKGMNMILGKSYAERKAEAEEAKQTQEQQYQDQLEQMQQMQQANPYTNMYGNQNLLASNNYMNVRPTMTPQQMMAMRGMLYGGGMTSPMDKDFMAMSSGINRLNIMC